MTKSGKRAAAALFSALCLVGCTSVDDKLGVDLVPVDQQAIIRIDTLGGVDMLKAYQGLPDSMVTSNQGFIMFGVMQDPDAGTTTISGAAQYLPNVDKTFTFGYNPVADSLILVLDVTGVEGDTTTAKQKEFYIYEMAGGTMNYTSTYFKFFDPAASGMLENYTPGGEPLFKFKFSGGITDSLHVTLWSRVTTLENMTSKSQAFIDKLLSMTTGDMVTSTAFHTKYGGLYITPAPTTVPADGAIPQANLNIRTVSTTSSDGLYTYNYSYTSYFILYSHNFDQTTGEIKDKDTTQYWFVQQDPDYGTVLPNASAISIKHDYSATPIQAALDNGTDTTAIPLPVVYSHSPMGATPMIRVTGKLVNSLNALRIVGADTLALAVNRAELQIPITSTAVPFLDRSPQRLGMYYKYQNNNSSPIVVSLNPLVIIPVYTPIPMPDFLFPLESQGYTLPFGGYLQRAKGYYSMDVTSYVQQLEKGSAPSMDSYFGMVPTANVDYTGAYYYTLTNAFSDAYTAMDGTKLKLIITYTLIR